jgi:hypothetical protein
MLRLYYLISSLICGLVSFSQTSNAEKLQKRCGWFVYIGKRDVWSPYFIEAPLTGPYSFSKSDTLRAIMLAMPGCAANDSYGYRYYLRSQTSFDSIACITIIDNDKGMYIEDSCMLEYKRGCISYFKSDAQQWPKQYEKVIIQNKKVILETDEYLRIKEFTYAPLRAAKK